MKTLLYILLLLFSTNCFGQTETKEDFVNEVYIVKVSDTVKSYPLSKEASRLFWLNIEALRKETREVIDSSSLEQMIYKALKDTLDEEWNFQQLRTAKYEDWRPALIKKSKRNFVLLERTYYYFSKPIFNDLHTLAMITLSYHCGHLCGDGCVYVFKKINGHWIKIAETNCWIS